MSFFHLFVFFSSSALGVAWILGGCKSFLLYVEGGERESLVIFFSRGICQTKRFFLLSCHGIKNGDVYMISRFELYQRFSVYLCWTRLIRTIGQIKRVSAVESYQCNKTLTFFTLSLID